MSEHRSVMERLLAAAGWDAGSLRHKQLESALDGARLGIVDHAPTPNTPDAIATWNFIERLLIDECGLREDEGLKTERPNFINAIRNATFVVPDQAVVAAAIEFLSSGEGLHKIRVNGKMLDRKAVAKALTQSTATNAPVSFQSRVDPWLMECFGLEIARDILERNHRFLEEALELVQANGCTAHEAHQLVDYVYGRDQGEINQEVGGVMVTLAALCLASGVDMHEAAETELARVWTKVEKIRSKHFAKPKFSPLPGAAPAHSDAMSDVVPDDRYSTAIVWSDEDQTFLASTPELPGCIADGETKAEALRELADARAAWIGAATEIGKTIPGPTTLDNFPDGIATPAQPGDVRTNMSGTDLLPMTDVRAIDASLSVSAQPGDVREIIEERARQIHMREHSHFADESVESDKWAMYRIRQELNLLVAALSAPSAAVNHSPDVGNMVGAAVTDIIKLIDERIIDLNGASAAYPRGRLDTDDKIGRNNREISWLKDLRSIVALARKERGAATDGGSHD